MIINNKKKYEIIIQAGGRGSRLRHFTWNKPKCLVSFEGKPVIFHLFEKFKDSNFHIIADYQIDKIKKYFKINPPKNKIKIYKTSERGTCAGIKNIINKLNKKDKKIIIWSDLILKKRIIFKKSPTIVTTSLLLVDGQ